MDNSEIYNRYGITTEEVDTWADRQIPPLPKIATFRAIRYLQFTKGIGRAGEAIQIYGIITPKELTLMCDVKPEVPAKIRGYAAAKIRTNTFNACPQCKKKVSDESVCPGCGQEVEPVESTFEEWIVGDESNKPGESGGTTLVCSFPPSIVKAGLEIEGQMLTLVGAMQVSEYNGMKQERFNVKKIINENEVAVPEKTASTAKDAKAVKTKDTGKSDEDKKAALVNMLKVWKSIDYTNVESWYKQNEVGIPLLDMLMAIGAKVKDGKVTLE